MSLQNAQRDTAAQWLSEAKAALGMWGSYYRAGFSSLVPRDSVIGRAFAGHIQQPINAVKLEISGKNDATDAIISKLPAQMRTALVEVYGMRYSVRHAAERADMNYRAYRDMLQAAEGGVAVGLAMQEETCARN